MTQRGFTLLELMVTIAIAVILLGLGVSAFTTMMASTRTRNTAESMLSGLRLARAEAIRRNVPMRFQLVSSLDNTCTYSATSPLWVVTQTDAVGTTVGLVATYCGSMPYTPPDQPDICTPNVPACSASVTSNCRGVAASSNPSPGSCTSDPLVAYKSDGNVTSNVNVLGSIGGSSTLPAYVVTFNPLGRIVDAHGVNLNVQGENLLDTIDITYPSNTSAKAWRIQIAKSSGSLWLCNPDTTVAATSAQACH